MKVSMPDNLRKVLERLEGTLNQINGDNGNNETGPVICRCIVDAIKLMFGSKKNQYKPFAKNQTSSEQQEASNKKNGDSIEQLI